MENNILNNLFLDISDAAYLINVESIKSAKMDFLENNMINRFLKYALNLVKADLDSDIIDMELQYEINRIGIRKDINDDVLKGFFIIKSLLYSIAKGDYDKILKFADRYVNTEIYEDIYNKFYGSKAYALNV